LILSQQSNWLATSKWINHLFFADSQRCRSSGQSES